MNDIDRDLRRSVGLTPERTLHRIVQKTGHAVTERQIEAAGRAYVSASIRLMLVNLGFDALRAVARLVWTVAILGMIAASVYLLNRYMP